VRANNPFAVDPAKWISSLTEQFDAEDNHEDFLEAVKLEMYSDQVFCFTPTGEVIKLPRGATPIDYAYAIHTRIGSACVGAKVDGLRVPLWTRLKNGQSVEIITAEGQVPQVTWLEIATTGKAKAAIRRALREVDRERFIKLGQELARSAFVTVGKRATDKVLLTAARHLRLEDRETLLAQLGNGELSGHRVVQAVYPDLVPVEGDHIDEQRAVIGLEAGQKFERAPCCLPLPGERIVGISFRDKGVMIHAIDCKRLTEYDDQPNRWLDLHWRRGSHPPIYTATLELTISNDAGVLGRICTLIGEQKANISDLEFLDRKPDFYRLLIYLNLRDVEHLHSAMLALEAESHVAAIERFRDPAASQVAVD
jgi:GTP pyrophosphokinase/guanosine-3',5'-bis(diphosphate) 3'-pyrophosphohydrolase